MYCFIETSCYVDVDVMLDFNSDYAVVKLLLEPS